MTEEKSQYELELYTAHVCPFGQRAWFTILQKGIDTNLKDAFKIHWIDLNNKPKEFSANYAKALGANPASDGAAPTIQHNGKYMAESAVVAKYLDRAYNDASKYGPSLIPSDALDAAKVELMTGIISSHFIGPFYGLLMNTDDSKHDGLVAAFRSKLLDFNKKLLATSDKGFLLGDKFSIFEILAFPFFYRFGAMEILKGVPTESKWINPKCEESKGLERVINWYETVNALDSVKKMREVVTTKMLAELYAAYANDVVFYNNQVCPFGQRAWFALEAKGVKYNWKQCSLSGSPTPKEEYFKLAYSKAIGREKSSDGKVPIIKHQKKYYTESMQVVRYIDRIFNDESRHGKSLFPGKEDPVGSHACECLVDYANSNIMPAFYKILRNDDRGEHEKLKDKLYNDLKEINDRLNEVSDSGLLLKDNRLSGFEVTSFSFFWRLHLHPLISKESKKDLPIDKWLEKDSKEYPELKRIQDWYYTLSNNEVVKRMNESKEHPMSIEKLAEVYGKFYSKPLKN